MTTCRLIAVLALAPAFLFAQEKEEKKDEEKKPAAAEEESTELAPGHSQHGEVFNEGPRQAAVLIEGTGDVHFEITTESAEAQKFFDQGVGQLHGFWTLEAERSFRQVAAIDPECAMAYWGMAMANLGNSKRGKGFAEEAVKRKVQASEREQKWIDAISKYFGDGDEKKRRRDFVRAFENLTYDYPDDVEAKAFLMKQIYANKGKHPIPSHMAIDLLIKEILAKSPMHPGAHHYRIHLWDHEKAERALDSSAKFGPAAPAIAHAWHMPGHIYSRLHRFNDAVWQQEASARVDHAHMMRYQIIPDDIHNFAHNNEWLIRNMNHLGQVKRSVDLACNMIELPRLPKLNDKGEYNHNGGSWNYGRQRLRDTLMRFEEWEQLKAFGETDYLKAGAGTINESEWRRIMGIAAFESDNVERGQQLLAEIDADLESIKAEQDEAVKKAEEENKDKKEAEKKKAVDAAKKKFKSRIDARERVRKELHAYNLAYADEPNAEEAGKAIEAAKTIAKARKSRLYLKLGNKDKAVELATQDADGAKNQVAALANKIWVLQQAEKDVEEDFEKLRKIAHVADLDSALMKKVAHLGDGDWRIAEETAKDLGDRPDLNALGPFRWSPPEAPAFTLNNAEDKPVSLSDYSGKPTLVIFFLGRGCTHCMEQLNEFAPMKEDFAAAGIDIVAVSTDNTEGLRATYAGADEEAQNPFPFPLLSDEKLEAFRAYRAYDDFEKIALHGTFLIDEVGRIRWHDISYEPFMKPEFVLEESKRLLSYEDS